MLPFRITPALWAIVGLVSIGGLYWVVDQIGDIRETKVHAHYAEVERQKKLAEEEEARAGEEARQPAFLPGSLKRLQANWCRDCKRATQ